MANSLRAKLSKLRHDRLITEEEYQAFIKKLDGHDKHIRAKAFDDVLKRVREHYKFFKTMPSILLFSEMLDELSKRRIDMIRAYDDYGNVIDMVEYEKQIREKAFDELASTLKLNWLFRGDKPYRDEIDKVVERIKENR